MIHRYRAHGLVVASEIPLPLVPEMDADGSADLHLAVGETRPVPDGDPPGERVAHLTDPGGRVLYSMGRNENGTILRYPGLCEFVGDPYLRHVSVHTAPGGEGVVPVLAAGALLAVHLRLRSRLVLHASAVCVDGSAVAFVGASGMGKSTMATLFCAAGHPLVSDDVLTVDVMARSVDVHSGSTETRLRETARSLAATMPGPTRTTGDGRLAVRAEGLADGRLPLGACLVPQPRRDRAAVEVRTLPPARALMLLARFPRLPGWVERGSLASEFQQLGELVERVPVLEAHVPWGPPFIRDVVDDVLAGLRAAQR